MNVLKNAVKQAIASSGYTIRRAGDTTDQVTVDVFTNLTKAYEYQLNERNPDSKLSPNERRPKLLARLLGTPPSEAYFLLQGLARSRNVKGDVCEFGVAQGETSALIANEIEATGKILHLFDSFEGLPKPTEQDRLKDDIFNLGSMDAYTGTMSSPEDMVLARLAAIRFPRDRYVIHKGFIDQVFKTDRGLPSSVSFAYVDFDFYQPIVDTLRFLHDRMPVGGAIVVDDYDWFSTGAKSAVDEFVAAQNTGGVTRYTFHVPDKTLGCFAVLDRVGL